MNFENGFRSFPTLRGKNIVLRKLTVKDVYELFSMLKDEDVIREYSPIGEFTSIDEVFNNYIYNADINFENKSQVAWGIEDINSGKLIGVREMFIDFPAKPVTVQGFIAQEYRKKGLSKEAYNLIIEFAKRIEAVGLLANTSIENYPAIALMHSVGYRPSYIEKLGYDCRMVFIHDLRNEFQPKYINEDVKRIDIFCKMYLHGSNIVIREDGLMNTDNGLHKCYDVRFVAKNTFENLPFSILGTRMRFFSDGDIIMRTDPNGIISSIKGRTEYKDAWHYAWNYCTV